MTREETTGWAMLGQGLPRAAIDAALVLAICAVVALGVDLLWHPEGIPLIAARPYQTLVPCPVARREVAPVEGVDERLRQASSLLIDARPVEAYRRQHLPGARNVPYDYLDPTPERVIRQLGQEIAASRARRVIVYGDGDDPDTGRLLAEELAAQGLRHVMYVRGGFAALKPNSGARP